MIQKRSGIVIRHFYDMVTIPCYIIQNANIFTIYFIPKLTYWNKNKKMPEKIGSAWFKQVTWTYTNYLGIIFGFTL